jgi:hypothetical protein
MSKQRRKRRNLGCFVQYGIYSSHGEDMPILEDIFFLNDEGEASTSGIKSEGCKAVLWSGTLYPRDKLPKTLTKERTKSRIKAKRLKA